MTAGAMAYNLGMPGLGIIVTRLTSMMQEKLQSVFDSLDLQANLTMQGERRMVLSYSGKRSTTTAKSA